ncbi:Shedu immune nuclease family protein [Arcobacter sp.]|uniref:Shedu immune nuclease family protein n=1 Tax=unclassified Arcobacter TaxID=2593671 RepID=UPI003B0035A3
MMTQEDKEYMYFNKLEKNTLSVSPQFKNTSFVEGKEFIRFSRGVSMKFGESPDHKMHKRVETKDGIEIDLKTTDNKQQEIKAYFYEDTRNINTLTIQRWMTKTGNAHKESMVIYGEQLDLLINFVSALKGIPLNGKGKVTIPIDMALNNISNITDDTVLNYLEKNPNLINKIVNSQLTEKDIVSIGYRKEQLNIFKSMLNNDNLKESDWQNFFEKNTWIFGYGLSYIFNEKVIEEKLEQYSSGFDFNTNGKRTDALLKTSGFIKSLCFVEIKTHKTDLLKQMKMSYRGDCWAISDELAGGVSQVQNTISSNLKKYYGKIEIKNKKTGNLTGEEIFNFLPSSFLIIGKLDEFISEFGVNEDKYRSFELFRKNINSPEIITFDELYERAKYIVESNI